jgi:hypothetical protein
MRGRSANAEWSAAARGAAAAHASARITKARAAFIFFGGSDPRWNGAPKKKQI